MSDFLNDIQCDELVDGQYFDGQYVPTEQDLADMNSESLADEKVFCAICGVWELKDYALSPDSTLCISCYQYNWDNSDYMYGHEDSSCDDAPDDPSDWGDDGNSNFDGNDFEGYDD